MLNFAVEVKKLPLNLFATLKAYFKTLLGWAEIIFYSSWFSPLLKCDS
jgi:hypothetical protein